MLENVILYWKTALYEGYRLGSDDLTIGEIVFNTAMTGYQETISDPSYTGQIITFTYPLIGNYGINRDDFESLTPTLNGVVVKEEAHIPAISDIKTLHEVLVQYHIPGISGVDTRSITRKIRQHGVLRAGFTDNKDDIHALVEHLKLLNYLEMKFKQYQRRHLMFQQVQI